MLFFGKSKTFKLTFLKNSGKDMISIHLFKEKFVLNDDAFNCLGRKILRNVNPKINDSVYFKVYDIVRSITLRQLQFQFEDQLLEDQLSKDLE